MHFSGFHVGTITATPLLFVSGSALGEGAVYIFFKRGDRQAVALHGVHRLYHLVHEVHKLGTGTGRCRRGRRLSRTLPVLGNVDLPAAVAPASMAA